MQGYSGTYAINNTDLTLQPSEGQWLTRTDYGVDGGAHTIYALPRKFELKWDLISPTDLKQIIDFYNAVGNTGTVVFCLPKWGDADYQFYNYSGTTVAEPEVGAYFQGYIQSVKMLVMNIRT